MLAQIAAINPERVELFASRTRDRGVPVLIDPVTGVIFIDEFFVGEQEYRSGAYRGEEARLDFEDFVDTARRRQFTLPLVYGRSVLDFGCGAGGYLRSIQHDALSLQGIELQDSYRESLNSVGIPCLTDMRDVNAPVDVVTMFHVLEHLPHPLQVLDEVRTVLPPAGGVVIVEVPHARDLLISKARCQAFIDFTLWSQHLVLHTRDSLTRLLQAAGFTDIVVEGIQRYGFANHLTWLSAGQPGGHKGPLAVLETPELRASYQAALAAADCTDTLVAVARTGPST
jgi:2-polyprenyl-3-methyl-5-hydroxy-6-metoxy-1,4-benzoquinol methylase